jgi:hypothetical protein
MRGLRCKLIWYGATPNLITQASVLCKSRAVSSKEIAMTNTDVDTDGCARTNGANGAAAVEPPNRRRLSRQRPRGINLIDHTL